MIPDRQPVVRRRRGDPEYHMRYAVAGRAYFAPTGHTDRTAAQDHADAAFADRLATRRRHSPKIATA